MKFKIAKGVALALAMGTAMPAFGQALFDGCPSGPIMAKFGEFGRTGQMPPDLGKWLGTPEAQIQDTWAPFDNVDYVGICWVSSWLVHTTEGTVLIDTLYGPFTKPLLENIAKTGTDLADIKYVLMTHGHFDHVGGAAALKPLLPNATFVMTQKGWDEAAKDAAASQGGRRAWDMIETDLVVATDDKITLGDNIFTALETPGHTWGTASYMFDVQDAGETYRAVTIGGLGLNAIEGPSQVEAFIESLDDLNERAQDSDAGIDVHLTTHGFSNGLNEDRQALAERAEGDPHVMVNRQGLLDQIATLRSGAVERLEIEKSKQ
ncbi:metallo-beta-lactamase class B [Pacificibacter maritimus]|uniref:Metallo-beta-lactamase class B n=1 Tax=Pacificibacter maritimus TaxID=762213 RepID=A0A3N4U9S8_9RHOB|nr:MBL fold metallo-hydrolase [Pacificibacter maritimus]RPE66528.1 metallo-beta-lactamase class B [Pacificibacter maritimus]